MKTRIKTLLENNELIKTKTLPRLLTQYTDSSNAYRPTLKTKDVLEAGIYKIDADMGGIYFTEHNVSTDDLLKFKDKRYISVLEELKQFWTLKEKFSNLGFIHKRGILLYGKPGCGKSCLVKLVAENVVRNDGVVFIHDARHIQLLTGGLRKFKEVEPNRNVVVVLEDIDKAVQCDEGSLLNLLDGDDQIDNVLYLATTNYIDRLPKRLMRSNRLDRKIQIHNPPAEGRRAYLLAKLGLSEDEETIEDIVKQTGDFSFADLREFLVSVYCLDKNKDDVIKRIKNNVEESRGYRHTKFVNMLIS